MICEEFDELHGELDDQWRESTLNNKAFINGVGSQGNYNTANTDLIKTPKVC
ncbi:hypothetical protein KIN20_023554 [Parelaphostrongylus tenuis]|uniref:Uncharacterized protein n=1 Tax=Parelaphostrongylus tenuis TaxID=148309 RepID=A0AAD5QVX4_PARTN|nr:hypothetical protein KIN20_023554 [Parelaphostrongylus tenuis]